MLKTLFKNSLQSWGLSSYITIALSIIILSLYGYINYQSDKIQTLTDEKTSLQVKLNLEKLNTKNALLILDNQNNEINQLKADTDKTIMQAQKQTQELKKRLAKIAKPKKNDKCETILKSYELQIKELYAD